jgi:hypothetical protein
MGSDCLQGDCHSGSSLCSHIPISIRSADFSDIGRGLSVPIQDGNRIGFNQWQNRIRSFLVNCLNCLFKGATFDLFYEIILMQEGTIHSTRLFSSRELSLQLEETFMTSPFDR